MNIRLSESEIKKRVELGVNIFLKPGINFCNFQYNDAYEYKFAKTDYVSYARSITGEKQGWEGFLEYLGMIGVQGFSYNIVGDTIYFVGPVINEISSYNADTMVLLALEKIYPELIESIRNSEPDYVNDMTSRCPAIKTFDLKSYENNDDLIIDLVRTFENTTYADCRKLTEIILELGMVYFRVSH